MMAMMMPMSENSMVSPICGMDVTYPTAVVNKRGGGTGLISGRKAFQRPMAEGVQLLNAIQDVYLNQEITVA